jgi:pimeloyl-ACP methyl ester carboxylesterase
MPDPTHERRTLAAPSGWVIYLSHDQPTRLVVFVHGFMGDPIGTWQRFPGGARDRAWWRACDMLFVGYDSVRDNITGVAARLRRWLPQLYPQLDPRIAEIGGMAVGTRDGSPYAELVLVGHSLGGVVLRRVLADVAEGWLRQREADPDAPRPHLLAARLCLFSPASAGFRAAGLLGIAQASSLWPAINMYLRRSSAYTDLQPESPILAATRNRTEALVEASPGDLDVLRARILWASPDNVVVTERYSSDHIDDAADGTSHSSVCKPRAAYVDPWAFVEGGGPP